MQPSPQAPSSTPPAVSFPEASPKKQFSISERGKSFQYAFRGVGIIFKTQHNAWIHGVFALLVIGGGVFFKVSTIEWALLLLSTTSVLAAEAFNTAVEIDIDLTSPNYHPFARDTKDVASAAVLITALGACIVGVLVFVPKLYTILPFLH